MFLPSIIHRPSSATSNRSGTDLVLRRIARLLGLLVAGTVAACASGSDPAAPPSSMEPASSTIPLHGPWQVIDVYPGGPNALSPHERQALIGATASFTASEAKSVTGQICTAPLYRTRSMMQSEALGYWPAPTVDNPMVMTVDVICQDSPFARLVQLPSGAVLTYVHQSWASLVAPSTVPKASSPMAPMMPMGYEMTPMSAQPSPVSVHLASYRSESMAREGWAVYEKNYAQALQGFHPTYSSVTVKNKGTFVRLMADGGSPAQADELCKTVHHHNGYCKVIHTRGGKASGSAGHSAH